MPENNSQSGLSREQKVGFSFLLIFGLLAVGLGFLQIRNNIYGPFIVRGKDGTNDIELLLDETARLQRIDTDKDSINDYDELNFYGTSPYLPDSDSDGLTDAEEISKGSDPLCVEGTDCSSGFYTEMTKEETSVASPLLEQQSDLTDIVSDVGQQALFESGLLNLEQLREDPQTLRKLLLATGSINEEQLEGISDDVLLETLMDLLGNGNSANNATSTVN